MPAKLETWETDINRLLTENISKAYWKTSNKAYNSINEETKVIAEESEIADRVDCLDLTWSFPCDFLAR